MRRSKLFYYIARRFLVMILAVYALCMVLIFLIDFVELLREAGKRGGTSAGLLAYLTLLRLPAYAELTLPFAALTGSIGAFLMLSRSSELVVMRAAGMSVWQFIRPGLAVAGLVGVVATTIYNPLSAMARAYSERLTAEVLGDQQNLFQREGSAAWLRQDGPDGPSVMTAGSSADQGRTLGNVTVLQFDKQQQLVARIEAAKAVLGNRVWKLTDATIARIDSAPEKRPVLQVKTYLSASQVADALGSAIAVSFWQLPGMIELANRAGRPSTAHKVQYQNLLARPLLLISMVLLAATVSLKAFRFGKVRSRIIAGLIAGFSFFILAEVSRQLGVAGLTTPLSSAWVPVGIACLASLSVLVHQEDG